MAIEAKISGLSEMKKALEESIETASLDVMREIGDMAIEHVYKSRAYQNRTYGLINSVGYGYGKKGNITGIAGFNVQENGADGKEDGIRLLNEAARECVDCDYFCVVVAGKKYASFVEAKGYNVISATELWMKAKAKDLGASLISKIEDATNE